jgi:hypothetical protein
MAQEIKSTIFGTVTGIFANIITGNIMMAVLTAFASGAAAYIGQTAIKEFHKYIKRKF